MLDLVKRLNKISIYLFYLACVVFLITGTLGSMDGSTAFKNNAFIEKTFRLVPVGLVFLSMPLSIISAFCLRRLNIMHTSILRLIFIVAGVFTLLPLFFVNVPGWVAGAAWVGVVYMLKANLKRFDKYIAERDAGL